MSVMAERTSKTWSVACGEEVSDGAIRQKVWDEVQAIYCSNDVNHDDITSDSLDTELVLDAIKEELDTYHKHGVDRKVTIDDCYVVTAKRPIKVRWVIINKGDRDKPEYRARLVAKEI